MVPPASSGWGSKKGWEKVKRDVRSPVRGLTDEEYRRDSPFPSMSPVQPRKGTWKDVFEKLKRQFNVGQSKKKEEAAYKAGRRSVGREKIRAGGWRGDIISSRD